MLQTISYIKVTKQYVSYPENCQYLNMNKEAHVVSTRSLGMFMYVPVKTAVFNSCLSSK